MYIAYCRLYIFLFHIRLGWKHMEYITKKAIKVKKICSKYSRNTQRLVCGEDRKEKPMRELRGMKNKNTKHVKILNKS